MNLIFRNLYEFLSGVGSGTIFIETLRSGVVILSSMVAIGKRNDVFAIGYLCMKLHGLSSCELKSTLKENWEVVYSGILKINASDKIKIRPTEVYDFNLLKAEANKAANEIAKSEVKMPIPTQPGQKRTKKSITNDVMRDRRSKHDRRKPHNKSPGKPGVGGIGIPPSGRKPPDDA